MQLSVIVPTLDNREQLARTLDALADHAPGEEVVVVNGPSTDGTTGMVRERGDVDVLVETADREVAAARNAGIEHASGDAVAFVDPGLSVTAEWTDAVAAGLAEADVATGPVREQLRGGVTADRLESERVGGREVDYFNAGNVAVRRTALDALDGFDEYLETGSARDLAHRLPALDRTVTWRPDMSVSTELGADGGSRDADYGWQYRSLAYSLVKNYGVRPGVVGRLVGSPVRDALGSLREVARGEWTASDWLGTGRDVVRGLVAGTKDGLWARTLDRTPRRNPNGRSVRSDRAVAVYRTEGVLPQ
ncbi:MAG: glycosyltransferase family 2 protein [Haloarculaceae archaeon]